MRKLLLAVINITLICSLFGYNVHAQDITDVSDTQEVTESAETTQAENETEEEIESVSKYDEKKGIASIRLMFCADSGAKDIIKTGYAFFVGNEESIYLISSCDTVLLTDKEKKNVAKDHGIEKDKVNTVIEMVLKDDVIVQLSVVNSSEGMDFAILQPATKISSCTMLRLCEDATNTKIGDVVRTYNADMQSVDCTIEDWSEIDNAHFYRYSAPEKVSKGMPLINADGEVVGITSSANKGNEDESYAIQIDEVIDVLSVLGIKYNADIVVNTDILSGAMALYEELEEKKYTAESWKACKESYDNAVALIEKVNNNEVNSYTQDEIKAAALDLNEKMDNLEEAGISAKTMIVIAILEAVFSFIIIITLIILLIVKTKKYKKLLKEEQNRAIMAREALKITGRVTPGVVANNTNTPVNRSLSEAGNSIEDNSETSVLGADMLYKGNTQQQQQIDFPTVLRYKTGESFVIKQNSFVIGTAAEAVDYCVLYNTSISRKHACILRFADGYYIQDLETTNGTFVNDMRVMPGRYVKLEPGYIIKLAEEVFEFKG